MWPKQYKVISAIIGIILWIPSLACLGYWLIYGQDFSQSAIFIIFESNFAEGSEFIESYLRWWHIPVFLFYSAIPFVMWRLMPPLRLSIQARYIYITLFSFVIAWPFLNKLMIKQKELDVAGYHLITRMEPASPWTIVVGFFKYRDQLSDMEGLLASNHHLPPLKGFKENESVMPDTLVLVVGESTNRTRMSLYGYPRKTTPQLDKIRDELMVFNDVVTPRPYTIEALQQVLSFADEKSPLAFFDKPNLMNMLKQAGYEITWVTNQQTQTRRNTMLTTLSQMADRQVYLNNNRSQSATQLDGAVVTPYKNVLLEPAKKKVIVVHLLGTHRRYRYRYPDSFDKFVDNIGVPEWVKDDNLEEYNSYDNAILYNDDVVVKLINGLQEKKGKSLLIYFSDHGEEVFDSPGKLFTGRNEYSPSPAMYTVPFIAWASSDFLANGNAKHWSEYINRPFTTADFVYTLPEMIGIDFDQMDYTRSLVSKTFEEHPRWIGDPSNQKRLQDFSDMKKAYLAPSIQ